MNEVHYLLGNSCNLNCDFCFWDKRTPDVPLDFKMKIIDEIGNSGVKKVILSGGEPLCSNDLIEVLEYMHKKGLEVVLHTNGLLINKTVARKVAPNISRISLTMDAIDKQIQLEIRKSSKITSHTIELITWFHDLNVPVNVKTLVTRVNQKEIGKIGKVLDGLPIAYWSLLEFVPINRGRKNKERFMLEPDEFDMICTSIKKINPLLEIKIRKYANPKNKYCFITPNGDVYTNGKTEDAIIGNIKNNNLITLINKIESGGKKV